MLQAPGGAARSPKPGARSLALRLVITLGAWGLSSCAPSGFADPSLVQTVRILASSADAPYAEPGAQVNLHVLAFDGRTAQDEPMTLTWLPFVCEDPANDAYYACFQGLYGGDGGAPAAGDAGARGSAGGLLQPGVDLTPLLPSGASYGFQMPADVVSAHAPVAGTSPYGIAILFNVACAGHLELLPFDPTNDNPQQVPLGCFDSSHNQLGPDDWVLGFTRVYSYAADGGPEGGPMTNANPIVSSVDVNGQTLAVAADPSSPQLYTTLGFTSARCTADTRDNCAHVPVGPVVPADSWELNPQQTDVNGNPSHEEIWAELYTTLGSFTDDARLLYDATSGSIGDASATDDKWLPPNDAGDGFIWIVVHDNRGGASWVTIPVHVQ
jgi:hypothetical protein